MPLGNSMSSPGVTH